MLDEVSEVTHGRQGRVAALLHGARPEHVVDVAADVGDDGERDEDHPEAAHHLGRH